MTTKLTPNLMVEDITASAMFYQDVLGFRFVAGVKAGSQDMVNELSEEATLQWAMVMRDEQGIMFQTRQSLTQEWPGFADMPINASATFYLEVDDVETAREMAEGRAEVILELRTTFYGMREFWIRDNSGYVVTVAQRMST